MFADEQIGGIEWLCGSHQESRSHGGAMIASSPCGEPDESDDGAP
jgi:hypothetical protein